MRCLLTLFSWIFFCCEMLLLTLPNAVFPQTLPVIPPETVGMSATQLSHLDQILLNATGQKVPGAVILVGRHGKIVVRKAYGNAQIYPSIESLEITDIFDLASITKPMATATAIMLLIEEGQLRLQDLVKQFIPEFSEFTDDSGKVHEPARIYHLLTHTSGLPAYTNAQKLEKTYGKPCPDSIIQHIARLKKIAPPGEKFKYSCLGFITLGEIVKRISGLPLNQFVEARVFKPLGMDQTLFNPPAELVERIVPTERIDDQLLRGTVHDPLARLMGGVSGNAGLFSTANDIAIFCQMLLNQGIFNNVRILHPLTVKRMTSIYEPVASAGRGLGWDIYTDYSSNKGDLFPKGGFGHTGYTGTSVWIDPTTDVFVILLTNRVHPHDDGSVIQLRSYVANVVAASIIEP